ncbi:MAG: hypothetical protein A4E57_02468 [Syntrophorhabdaceae bacterium PtaU1.Bin034]|jgi:hypothetical protein|nr:MAG: hypothetical protein A4E57_02468 [Syntrophorhabdaceae bacterium PtaU1.Bin034]
MGKITQKVDISAGEINQYVYEEAKEIGESLKRIEAIARQHGLTEVIDLCDVIEDKRLNVQLLTTVITEILEPPKFASEARSVAAKA